MIRKAPVSMENYENISGNNIPDFTGNAVTNSSDLGCKKEDLMIPFLIEMNSDASILAYIITIFGLIGNGITILKIVCEKALRKPTYVVIAALALADLTSLSQYTIHVIFKKVCQEFDNDRAFMSIHYGVTHLSAAHVVVLLSLRYYIIVYPLKSRLLTNQQVIKISVSVWILSIIFAVIYYFIRFLTCLNTFSTVVGFRSYLLVMPCVYIVFLHILKVRKIGHSMTNASAQVRRMSKMICVILTIYMLSALLFPICFILNATKICPTEEDCAPAVLVARIMWLFNNAVNPVIYFLFSPPIYRRLKYAMRTYSRSGYDFESSHELQRFTSSRRK